MKFEEKDFERWLSDLLEDSTKQKNSTEPKDPAQEEVEILLEKILNSNAFYSGTNSFIIIHEITKQEALMYDELIYDLF